MLFYSMDMEQTLTKLAKIKPVSTPFFSVYLNTLRSKGTKSKGEPFLRKMLSHFEDFHSQFGYDAYGAHKEKVFLERVLKELDFLQTPGLAVFVNSGRKLFETYPLTYSPDDQFFCQLTANLYPLVRLQHDLENFLTVVLDTREAKLFTISWGQISETQIVEKEEIKEFRRKGKLGLFKPRVENRMDEYVERYVEKVVGQVRRKTNDTLGFSFFAGDEIILPVVQKKLAPFKNLDYDFLKIDIKTPASEVLSKSLAAFGKIKKQKRSQILEQFLDQLGSERKIIASFEKAFENFKNDNILTLIVGLEPGYEICFCPFCWFWEKTIKLKTCPKCSLPMEVVDYKHKLVNLAYRFRVKFHFVEENPAFKKKEGVGAYLKR